MEICEICQIINVWLLNFLVGIIIKKRLISNLLRCNIIWFCSVSFLFAELCEKRFQKVFKIILYFTQETKLFKFGYNQQLNFALIYKSLRRRTRLCVMHSTQSLYFTHCNLFISKIRGKKYMLYEYAQFSRNILLYDLVYFACEREWK